MNNKMIARVELVLDAGTTNALRTTKKTKKTVPLKEEECRLLKSRKRMNRAKDGLPSFAFFKHPPKPNSNRNERTDRDHRLSHYVLLNKTAGPFDADGKSTSD